MLLPLVWLLFAAPPPQAVSQPSLDQLLDRVAQYVTRFQDDFAIVLSDEQYEQKDVVQTESGQFDRERSDGSGLRPSLPGCSTSNRG